MDENEKKTPKKTDYFGLSNTPDLGFDTDAELPEFSEDIFKVKKQPQVTEFRPEEQSDVIFELNFENRRKPVDMPLTSAPVEYDISSESEQQKVAVQTPSDAFAQNESAQSASTGGKFVVNFSDTEDVVPVQQREEVRRMAESAAKNSSAVPVSRKSNFSKAAPLNEEHKPAKKKKAKKRRRKKLPRYTAAVFLIIVVLATAAVSAYGISCLNDILAIDRVADERVAIDIPEDAKYTDVISVLSKNNLVKHPAICKLYYGVITNLLSSKGAPEFVSGQHYVDKDAGLEGWMCDVQVNTKQIDTVQVLFPEGWSAYQMFDKLAEFGVCSKEELVATLKKATFDYDFIKDVDKNSSRVFTLEGYLYPDTYEFYETSDANTIIRKMLSNFEARWTPEYAARAQEIGMSMDEVITLASIIQREAANTEQMADVSAVLHNRLNNPTRYPTLGCDATINYVNTYVSPNVSSSEATLYADAYNTSANTGLPAGPICNPGDAAIYAALYPSDIKDYYFLHDNNGKIYLAETWAGHEQNLKAAARANAKG